MNKVKRVEELLSSLNTTDVIRKKNFKRLYELYQILKINEKVGEFNELFSFLAINLTGISLQKDNFGAILPKRYVQIIAITRVERKMKNISLGYFGKSEKLEASQKFKIVEFVLRWRLEKSFMNVDEYINLLEILPLKFNISSNFTNSKNSTTQQT